MKTSSKFFAVALSVLACNLAQAAVMDRPQGLKFGERLTLRPYVSFDLTYDSNANGQSGGGDNTSWFVNPHLDLTYKSERFNADVGLFYGYRAYNGDSRNMNGHDYGENVRLAWTSAGKNEKGWSILLNERFQKVSEDDSLQNGGRGLWREHSEISLDGAIERRFTEKLHANVNGGYYWLDYDNDSQQYAPLYGWQRYMVGAEIGYAVSRWTDFILAGSYQGYTQDNNDDIRGAWENPGRTNGRYSSESVGYTVQGGIQSYATDRITYRLLAGWSHFEYGDYADSDGFSYTASANWKISDTWNTMLMAQSYYQPSEREYGSANRVDSVSWGLAHSMVRGKLNATFDAAYRRETRVYTDTSSFDYDEDIFSLRLGLDYNINRFLAVYARGEYQATFFDGNVGAYDRDYDRFRVSVGFRLQY